MAKNTGTTGEEGDEAGRSLMVALRSQIDSYGAACKLSKEAQASAKPALHAALHSLLLYIATHHVPDSTRSGVDDELCTNAQTLKWGLLRGLQRTDLGRAYLGLPRSMEQTRIFLAGITTKKSVDILEVELCRNIDQCDDSESLRCVREVVVYMTGAGRFKKDMGGVDLPKDAKRACRTAINRAEKAEKALRGTTNQQQGKKSSSVAQHVFMERDVRLEDREREAARAAACDSYLDRVVSDAAKSKQ